MSEQRSAGPAVGDRVMIEAPARVTRMYPNGQIEVELLQHDPRVVGSDSVISVVRVNPAH
jgi:hypothetical protein